MEIMEWWPKLDSDAQAWLMAHNGEAVAPEVLSKIVTAGGSVNSRGWWIGSSGARRLLSLRQGSRLDRDESERRD